MVTGTSVLAIKYKDGIMMAADTLGLSVNLTSPPKFYENHVVLLSVSLVRLVGTVQGRQPTTQSWRLHGSRSRRGYERLPILANVA